MSTPRIRLLTGGDVEIDPGLSADLPGPLPRALFVALLLIGTEPVSREYLAALLWPDTDAATGRQRLRMALHNLRRGLGPALESALSVTPDTLSMNCALVGVDLVEFETHAGADTAASRNMAIALYRGNLLERFPPISESFDELLEHRREECRAAFLSICRRALSADVAADDVAAYGLLLEKALRIERTNADLVADAMRFYGAAGSVQRVTEIFDRHARALRSEIEVDPEPEIAALRDDMRALALKRMQARSPPAEAPGSYAPESLVATKPAARRPVSVTTLAAGAAIVLAVGSWIVFTRAPTDNRVFKLQPIAQTSGDCGLPEARTMFDDATEAAVRKLEGATVVLVGQPPDGEVFTVARQLDCDGLNARGNVTVVRERDNEITLLRRYELNDVAADALAEKINTDLIEEMPR